MDDDRTRLRALGGRSADAVDARLGDALELVTCRHHARRLHRLGHDAALEPASGIGAPLRAGNAIDVLVDGAVGLPAIAAAIAGARRHVHVIGWHVEPDFALVRDGRRETVAATLRAAAARVPVRVLVWAGAPLPVFKPSRASVRQACDGLRAGGAVRVERDARERPLHCHHDKIVVVDDEVAFVGGMDMTALGGDRYDEPGHPERGALGWHDVVARIRGPLVADVAAHFALRWREIAREALPPSAPPEPAGDVSAAFVRTVPEREYAALPRGDFSALQAYLSVLASAERLVYLENQFLWSPELVRVLAEKLRRPPHPDFRLVLLLPARPNNGADDTRGQLGVLTAADGGGGRLLACTIFARSERADPSPVYVHAKVAVVDDRRLVVGSVNLNEHSLFNDGEAAIVVDDPRLARDTRERLWAEHADVERTAVSGEPSHVVDEILAPAARAGRAHRDADLPGGPRLATLAGRSRRAARLRGPLDGLLVDG